ncbi:MAG: hypothetical protein NVS1B10_08570 [Candidatus Saccharimonadales bacterium]
MDRRDTIRRSWPTLVHERRRDQVILEGTGREAELIIAGLRVLRGQIAIRDITVESEHGFSYGHGSRFQGNGVPLAGEVDELLEQIAEPKPFNESSEASPAA